MWIDLNKYWLKVIFFLLAFSTGISGWWYLSYFASSDSPVPSVKTLTSDIQITDADRMEIINSILNDRYFRSDKPDKSKILYLSIVNLPEVVFKNPPQVESKKVILLPINPFKKNPQTFPEYIWFSDFEVCGDKVSIRLTRNFVSGNRGSAIYEYKKIAGKWRGKITGSFAMAS